MADPCLHSSHLCWLHFGDWGWGKVDELASLRSKVLPHPTTLPHSPTPLPPLLPSNPLPLWGARAREADICATKDEQTKWGEAWGMALPQGDRVLVRRGGCTCNPNTRGDCGGVTGGGLGAETPCHALGGSPGSGETLGSGESPGRASGPGQGRSAPSGEEGMKGRQPSPCCDLSAAAATSLRLSFLFPGQVCSQCSRETRLPAALSLGFKLTSPWKGTGSVLSDESAFPGSAPVQPGEDARRALSP